MKLDFNDILIVPKTISDISSRTKIDPYYIDKLPLITAPMDTVVSEDNVDIFEDYRIYVCQPRGLNTNKGFKAYSIQQVNQLFTSDELKYHSEILIDIANGHMNDLVDLIKVIKKHHPTITLMVGNIANPSTYEVLSDAGADFIRVGIGNGNGCLTTQNTGVGYPMASLIKECYEISTRLKNPAYIVADGGMKDYSDIIKALALGADYVMLGSILNKSLESAGENFLFKKIKVSKWVAKLAYKLGIPIYKKFRGMSTKEVQIKWGAQRIKTSEGVIRYRKVEYTLPQWVENFEHYLRSAMSYSGAKNLSEFIGKADFIQISDNAYKRFNK